MVAAGASSDLGPGLKSIPSPLSLISKDPCLCCESLSLLRVTCYGPSHLLIEAPFTQKPQWVGPQRIILSTLKKTRDSPF